MILFWLILGLVLAFLELIVPGAVLVFLGLGAATTGALIYFGVINTWLMAFICWFITSIIYLLVLRSIIMKIFPGDESVDNTDEEADAAGCIVEVTSDIRPEKAGRIKYLDSGWDAYASSIIAAGEKAMLVSRNGNGWNVEPIK